MKTHAFVTPLILALTAAALSVPAFADVVEPEAISGGTPWVYLIIAVVVIAVAVIAGVLRRLRRRKDGMR